MTCKPSLPIRKYRQLQSRLGLKKRIREALRDTAIFALSLMDTSQLKGDWIRFPYYHHVFDDECKNFEKQLKYMKNLGDFISLDDSILLLESDQKIKGRYFCITFDDGFKNCLTNAVPMLQKYKVHAAFFLPTKYIGSSSDDYHDTGRIFFSDDRLSVEFLTWEDCSDLLKLGMSIGSHTVNHKTLSSLSDDEVKQELINSKSLIEERLGINCVHFCAPVGVPGRDFILDRDPEIAKKIGYCSFLTTKRGSGSRRSRPFFIERDHMIANWDIYQLRYFFSQ